jgi:hypothetical protein
VASRCLVPPIKGKPHLFLLEVMDICITNHLALYSTYSAKETGAKSKQAPCRNLPGCRFLRRQTAGSVRLEAPGSLSLFQKALALRS